MAYQLTPAAERALAAAARWALGPGGDVGPVGSVEMLIGLLHESECKAARLLGTAGIDEASVRSRWPELAPTAHDAATAFAMRGAGAAIENSLRDACERLDESLRSF